MGRRGRQGLRFFSVSGRVRNPGEKLAPAGVTARELVEEFSGGMLPGHRFVAYLPGGASGGILPERLADLPLDFGTLDAQGCFVGSGAVVILSDQDDLAEAARNLVRFFREESCGQCTPCRVGTAKAAALLDAPRWDRALLEELRRGDGRWLDLRPRPGGDEPGAHAAAAHAGGESHDPLHLDGREVEAAPGESLWDVARREGTEIPHLCHRPSPATAPMAIAAPAWSRSRASGCSPPPASASRATAWRCAPRPNAPSAPGGWCSSCCWPTSRAAAARDAAAGFGQWTQRLGLSGPRFAAERTSRRPTSRTRRWRCSSTPASSAACASAPAARCSITTSSAWRGAAWR